jgi:hypothetical protein
MECPICKEEISENDGFCAGCGFFINNTTTDEVEQQKSVSLSIAKGSSGEKPLNVGSLGRALIFHGMASYYDETVVFVKQMLTVLNMKVKMKGIGISDKDKNEEIVISGTERVTWKIVQLRIRIKISRKGDDLILRVGDDLWIYLMIFDFIVGLVLWPGLIIGIIVAVRYYAFYPKLVNGITNFLMTKAMTRHEDRMTKNIMNKTDKGV